MVRALVLAISLMFASDAMAARLALVIGNRDYALAPLKNPVNDAEAIGSVLRDLGFEVTLVRDLRRDQIGATVDRFANAVRPGDDVVFFYAGHGVQIKGSNYLPATDAAIRTESDVPLNSLNLNHFLERIDETKAGVRLFLIDACRDNPYSRTFRSASRGLARVESAPTGTLLHFATRPGGVAADGFGANGLYTKHLLQNLRIPGLAVESMLKRVASGVRLESGGDQQPWTEGALEGDFYFIPPMNAGSSATSTLPPQVDKPLIEAPASTQPSAAQPSGDWYNVPGSGSREVQISSIRLVDGISTYSVRTPGVTYITASSVEADCLRRRFRENHFGENYSGAKELWFFFGTEGGSFRLRELEFVCSVTSVK
jgi:hypothetical protein